MEIGDKVMVWDQNYKTKVEAEILKKRESQYGNMLLLKMPYGEVWRSEEAVFDRRVLP